MSIKIYLIKHHDTGMGYVGITGDELGKRWYQHLHDPKGALYAALRAEGHRMSMQLLEEVETRAEALIKEQEYIHALGTAQPAGWNRDVRPLPVEKQTIDWFAVPTSIKFDTHPWLMYCTCCGYEFTHQQHVEIFQKEGESAGGVHTTAKLNETIVDENMDGNPSDRRNGLIWYYSCESCHGNFEEEKPPFFEIHIEQYKGQTRFFAFHYEDTQKLIREGRI
jgi:hypothetical protein